MSTKVCSLVLCGFLLGCAARNPADNSSNNSSNVNPTATTPQSAVQGQRESQSEPKPEVSSEPISPKAGNDACALITNSEISAVQGQAVQETKASSRVAGTFVMSQCFYQLPIFHNSISLEVTRRDPANSAKYGPKERWQELFHAKDKPTEKKKDSGKPLKVAGVGDEAFWVGDRVSGALYVLKANTYFRISIGGPHEQSVRVKRSKTLAQKALARL